jgi:hypothetical protein
MMLRPPNALFALILAVLVAIVGLLFYARSRAAVAGPCEAGGCACRASEGRRSP